LTSYQLAVAAGKAWLSIILVVAIVGCASPVRLTAVPVADTARALPLGIANARFLRHGQSFELIAEWKRSLERQRQALGLAPDSRLPEAQFLAISGGGDNGAFGAGLLIGWREAGDRPEFEIVTGVSTGALIAPFAFLGPDYDQTIREVYTSISADDIFRVRWIVGAIFDDALADTTPLWDLISRHIDERLMAAIAREYERGRLLLIGTTNLDAQRANIWNIGAIAASGDPGALDLIRKILRASSAIPGFFQPVLIDVEMDGKSYQELHVDGGAIAQMFLYPPSIRLEDISLRARKAYLISNAREDPDWAEVERRTLSIAGKAIATMIHSGSSNDLLRLYFVMQRDNVDYNLAYIGSDFSQPHAGEFDKTYMNALFNYGYQKARRGYPWQKAPPTLADELPK
jgi:predicted patatin/cPLA2 family phospholipase